jgi:acetyltransferase-like isoleucine patch superfamily enzyme
VKKQNEANRSNKNPLPGVFIHANALVESTEIGAGTRIWAFAHVMKDASIGPKCNICDHAFIESNAKLGKNVTVKNGVAIWDGVVIEDDVFLGPHVVLTNDPNPRAEIKKPREQWLHTLIRRGATIGANATVLCGITVGSYAFIAAGAVVTRKVPDYALIVGVPGRRKGWMCRCATRLRVVGGKAKCRSCGRSYRKTGDGLRADS